MNKFKSTSCVIILLLSLFSIQAQAPAPVNYQPPMGFPFGAEGMPKMSEEDIKAFQEAQEMINNMKPEELEEVFSTIEKILSGEIDPAEVFGPMPAPAPKPQPAPQPKPEEKVETPAPACTVEKQVALRNKNEAQIMINALLEHIAAIRVKASTDSKVADELIPWNSSLDSLVYYLHVIIQKHHLERLVCEQDFTQLHDALKQLQDVLAKNEPQLKTRELGTDISASAKERSKQALTAILQGFAVAFKQNNALENLEKLLKKYEPELVKKRKEIEAQEERAKKESESMKSWQPTPSRIKSEAEYAPREKFYDRWYDKERRRQQPYEAPRRIEEKPTSAREAHKPATGTKGEKAGEGEKEKPGKKGGEKATEGAKGEKGEKGGGKKYEPKNKEEIRLDRNLDDLEEAFDQVGSYVDTSYLLGRPGIVSYLPQLFTKKEDVEKNFTKPLDEAEVALHTIAKRKGDIESKMKKASEEGAKLYKKRLKEMMEKAQTKLQPIYLSLLNQLRLIKDNQSYGRMPVDKIYMLTGYKNVAGTPNKDLLDKVEPINHVEKFMIVYELIFKPVEAKERGEISAALAKKEAQELPQPKPAPKKLKPVPQPVQEQPTEPVTMEAPVVNESEMMEQPAMPIEPEETPEEEMFNPQEPVMQI